MAERQGKGRGRRQKGRDGKREEGVGARQAGREGRGRGRQQRCRKGKGEGGDMEWRA